MSLEIEMAVKKLQLTPGDVVVLKVNAHLSHEGRKRLSEIVSQVVPEHRHLILERDMELAVLTKAEIEART